jgi:hypothetical protein
MRPPTGRERAVAADGTGAPPGAESCTTSRTTGVARMAGWAGVLFAVLLAVSLVLVRQIPGLTAPDAQYQAFYAGGPTALVALGMYVAPFAGVACLWHMIATRTLVQILQPQASSQIPFWLQLASGITFVCMVFGGGAAIGALALLVEFSAAPPPTPDVARALTGVGHAMVFVFAVRAAGMYMITTTGLARACGLMPRWLTLLSYLAAAFLLVSVTYHPSILMVFPAWVLVVSTLLLVRPPPGRSA